MKRTGQVALKLATAALVLTGCDRGIGDVAEPTTTKPNLAAQVVTLLKGRFPIGPRTAYNDCSGEFVDIVGEYNLVVRQVTSATGSVHFMIHSVAGHVTGVGQTTGTQYVSNEHTNYTEHYDGPNYVLALEFGIMSVAKGRETNGAPGKIQIFVVVNANGEMTVDRFEIRFECQS